MPPRAPPARLARTRTPALRPRHRTFRPRTGARSVAGGEPGLGGTLRPPARSREREHALARVDAVDRADSADLGRHLAREESQPRPDVQHALPPFERQRRAYRTALLDDIRRRIRCFGPPGSLLVELERGAHSHDLFNAPRLSPGPRSSITYTPTCRAPAMARSRRACGKSASATTCLTTVDRSSSSWRWRSARSYAWRSPAGSRVQSPAPTADRPSAHRANATSRIKAGVASQSPAPAGSRQRITRG